jgi:hypothetical protein
MQLPVKGMECHSDQPICTTPKPKRLFVLGGSGERGPDVAYGPCMRFAIWEDSSTLRLDHCADDVFATLCAGGVGCG